MSTIHRSCVLVGARAMVTCGTARFKTVRSYPVDLLIRTPAALLPTSPFSQVLLKDIVLLGHYRSASSHRVTVSSKRPLSSSIAKCPLRSKTCDVRCGVVFLRLSHSLKGML